MPCKPMDCLHTINGNSLENNFGKMVFNHPGMKG